MKPTIARRKLLSTRKVEESLLAKVKPKFWYKPKEQNRMISVSGVLRTM